MQDWFLMLLPSRFNSACLCMFVWIVLLVLSVLATTVAQGTRRSTKCAQTTVALARYIYNAQRAYMSEEDRITGVIMANVGWNSCFTATLFIHILNQKRRCGSTWNNALSICKRSSHHSTYTICFVRPEDRPGVVRSKPAGHMCISPQTEHLLRH